MFLGNPEVLLVSCCAILSLLALSRKLTDVMILNIDRVKRLTREGRMTEYGLGPFRERISEISLAEKFKAEEPPFPQEFLEALKKNSRACEKFQTFAPCYKRRYLMWITSAKTAETKNRRVEEAVSLRGKNLKSLLK
jgi:uncharacterized protein YdeI (YjbR/CyaY-like superfamily)